jgi:hypothetical protein
MEARHTDLSPIPSNYLYPTYLRHAQQPPHRDARPIIFTSYSFTSGDECSKKPRQQTQAYSNFNLTATK